MTKPRPPVSFELALTKVAGELGWERTAELLGVAESTARSWSDPLRTPTAGDAISLEGALALDLAYIAACGRTSPFLRTFRLRQQASPVCVDADRIARGTARLAKESGEALSQLVLASQPGASDAARLLAKRESEHVLEAISDVIADLGGPEVPPQPDTASS